MAGNRPFRFGVLTSTATGNKDWMAKARRAEELGYHTLLVPDHLDPQLGPVAALSAAADATTRLRIGSYVFNNDHRHPALLSKECATIDLLSGGRFELGIGAGWDRSEYEQGGITFDPAPVRVQRLGEAVHIIKALLNEPQLSFKGAHYTVNGLEGWPKPVQQPRIPLLIGGGGKQVLSLAAREADIVSLNIRFLPTGLPDLASISAEATERKIGWVRDAAGDRYEMLELNIFIDNLAITDQPLRVVNQIAARIGTTREAALDSPHVLVGSIEQVADELLQLRERYGISYVSIFETSMDAFAPVITRLTAPA